jgi:RND superfamily putative drug exporter
MPSLATLLGRWFWWPQVIHPRGDHAKPKPASAAATDDANTAPLAVQKT